MKQAHALLLAELRLFSVRDCRYAVWAMVEEVVVVVIAEAPFFGGVWLLLAPKY